MKDNSFQDDAAPQYIDPEKQAKARRAYWPLKAVLAAKEYDATMMTLALEITKGEFNEEDIYNRLHDADQKLRLDIEGVHDKILWIAVPNTDYNFSMWMHKMHVKWMDVRRKKKLENLTKKEGE